MQMNLQQPSTDSVVPNNMIIPGSRRLVKEIFLAIELETTILGTP